MHYRGSPGRRGYIDILFRVMKKTSKQANGHNNCSSYILLLLIYILHKTIPVFKAAREKYAITEITNEDTLLKETLKSGSRSFLLSEKANSGIDVCTFPQSV